MQSQASLSYLIARIMFRRWTLSAVGMSPPVVACLVFTAHRYREHTRRGPLRVVHFINRFLIEGIDRVAILVAILLVAVHRAARIVREFGLE